MDRSVIKGIVVEEKEIKDLVIKLANQIVCYCIKHGFKKIVFIMILKGAFIFAADLLREIDRIIQDGNICLELITDGVSISRYNDKTTGGKKTNINRKDIIRIRREYQNIPIIILDDIIEEGFTIKGLIDRIGERENIEICCLLQKPDRLQVCVTVNFLGKTIPNVFVVGYGMGIGNNFRHLRCICEIDESKLPKAA